jgi:hypothetical protein
MRFLHRLMGHLSFLALLCVVLAAPAVVWHLGAKDPEPADESGVVLLPTGRSDRFRPRWGALERDSGQRTPASSLNRSRRRARWIGMPAQTRE